MTSEKTQARVGYIGVSFNKGLSGQKSNMVAMQKKPWRAFMMINGIRWTAPYRATEREAAIDYDRRVLELNLDRPLNILKRKP